MFEIAKIDSTKKSGLANGAWKYDAYPELESLEANSTITIAKFKGPGIITCIHITQLWVTVNDPARLQMASRGVILEMYWDDVDTPAVRVPIGDFFADGLGGKANNYSARYMEKIPHAYNCYIPMPFAKSAVIKLINENNIALKCYSFVEYEKLPVWDESFGYFHATWDRICPVIQHDTCLPMLHIEGEGQLIGRAYSIITPEPLFRQFSYVVEANNEFRIDGESMPSINYLGTEDSFGFSWGFQTEYCGQYCGINKLEINDTSSKLSIFRFFDQTKIRFSKSLDLRVNWAYEWRERTNFQNRLRCAVENGGAKVDYATTHYWYQRQIGYPHKEMMPYSERII